MIACSHCGRVNTPDQVVCAGCGAVLAEYVKPAPVFCLQVAGSLSDAAYERIREEWKTSLAGTQLASSKLIILEGGATIQALQ